MFLKFLKIYCIKIWVLGKIVVYLRAMKKTVLRRRVGLRSSVGRCKYEGCDRVVGSFSGGYCYSHSGRKVRKDRYVGYYNFHLSELSSYPYSELSGVYIGNVGRVNICHLIDKGRHPSVGGDLDNYIYLTWGEHSELDKHLFENDFEWVYGVYGGIWDKILGRLSLVLPRVKENTKYIGCLREFLDNKQ